MPGHASYSLLQGYLDIILCFIVIALVLEVERMVPLKLGKVDTKMQIRTTPDSLSHCTFMCVINFVYGPIIAPIALSPEPFPAFHYCTQRTTFMKSWEWAKGYITARV